MKDNFARALARVLVYEGGYSNDPDDPGGATMKGITQGTYNSWRRRKGLGAASVRDIAEADVMAIYKADYWDRIDADDLPPGVDFCMFDAAVNSGVGGSTKWAQGVCDLDADGDFGPKTKAAILSDDPEDFIRSFCSHRLGTLQRLRTWSKFGKGWAARIANVQKIALAWAEAADGPDPVVLDSVQGNAKSRVSDVPVSKSGAIITHAATVGGAVATGAAQAGQALAHANDAFSWLKYALGGLTIIGALAGLVVYFAQQANAAASKAVAKAEVNPDADAELPSVALSVQKAVADTFGKAPTGAQGGTHG